MTTTIEKNVRALKNIKILFVFAGCRMGINIDFLVEFNPSNCLVAVFHLWAVSKIGTLNLFF